MEMCREKGFRYLFTHKDSRQQQVAGAYSWIIREEPNEVRNIGKEKGRGRYANDVDVTVEKKKR